MESATTALRLAGTAGDVRQQAWAHAYLGWLPDTVDDLPAAADHYHRAAELFTEADDVNGYLQVSCGMIRVLRGAGRAQAAVEICRGIMDTLADARHRDRIPPNVREFTALSAVHSVSFVHLGEGRWEEAVDALWSIHGQFDDRGWHKQAGKVHLHLAHALARLGARAEAAAEYQAVLTLESRVPEDVRDEAHTGLTALTTGRPVPLIRFVQ
ncbi:hypothetical protein ABZY30_02825 [Streptomyces massasporeus]|uniref:hypothetical protein n=1 Tax=Streptomyces massasporeus TaxID=67324 RepID=UPI0033BA12C2